MAELDPETEGATTDATHAAPATISSNLVVLTPAAQDSNSRGQMFKGRGRREN
jgi:hypothetical protein